MITWPLSNSILDLLTTTNPNLANNTETHTGISDHFLVTFYICMKTKYETKTPRKLFNFQKADTNNLKSKVYNFTLEFLNSNPEKIMWIQTGRLYNIIYIPWTLSHKSDTCHGSALGSIAVCKEEISNTVEQGNTSMLYIGIIFVSVEIKWLRW